MDVLKKLSEEQVEELVCSLQDLNIPDSVHAFTFLKQMIEWKKKSSHLNFSVYSPNDNNEGLTFVLIFIIDGGVFCTYYSSTEKGCIKLKNALSKTKLIEKDSYCILTSIPARVHEKIGLEWRTREAGPYQHSQYCHTYVISREDALSLSTECSDEVYVRGLLQSDAEYIDSKWPHRNSISIKLIKGIISFSASVGVFSKENDQLLSWALKWYYGGIGVVQTVEEARRKGYAKAAVATLAKKIAQEDWPVHLVIIDDNAQSISLFTKMGFKRINKCYWYYFNVFDSGEDF